MTDQRGATPAMLAVDWGGTWCRVALIARQGEVLWQARRPNPRGGSTDQYLALGASLLSEAFAIEDIRAGGIGIAVAGPVDPDSGILYQPPNLMALDGVSLKRIWGERYGLPVVLGNDANLAALGEFHFGAGRDATQAGHPPKSLFYVTVSTGIGGGSIEGGSLLVGANGLTAEVGHTTVDTSEAAPRCQCGKLGWPGSRLLRHGHRQLRPRRPGRGKAPRFVPSRACAFGNHCQGGGGRRGAGRRLRQRRDVARRRRPRRRPCQRGAPVQPGPDSPGRRVSEGLSQLNLLPRIRQAIHERPHERTAQSLRASAVRPRRQLRPAGRGSRSMGGSRVTACAVTPSFRLSPE